MILKINVTNSTGENNIVILDSVAFFQEITTSSNNTRIIFNNGKIIVTKLTIDEISNLIDNEINNMKELLSPVVNIENIINQQAKPKPAVKAAKVGKKVVTGDNKQ